MRVAWLIVILALAAPLPAVPATDEPLHSIVFVTKRPGGYDVLLQALARQTSGRYELICVDELAGSRGAELEEMARGLGVNLAAVTLSKAKTYPHTGFGIANAFNTGFVLASGSIVTILQDNIYLPPNFVESTLQFHSEHPRSLISYPESRFVAPAALVNHAALRDPSSLSVLSHGVTDGPHEQGWAPHNEGTMPAELWDNMQQGGVLPFDWLECACCSVPWEALVRLNGVDEALDTGDDCHEVNMKQRSQMLGLDVWNLGTCAVQVIDHHRWERSELWTRFTRNTNLFRWSFMKQQMEFGEYPVKAANNFDLAVMRTHVPPGEEQGDDELVLVRLMSPRQGQILTSPFVNVEFELHPPHRVPPSGFVCASAGHPPTSSSCVSASAKGEVMLAVHAAGAHVLRVLLYDSEARLLSEAQAGILQRIPVGVGELARLAGAAEAASGRVKGEASTVRSGLEVDAVREVLRSEHDLPREALLFVFNKDPAHEDTWRDGLWAALRILARHYDIQYLNVNDVVVSEEPEIAYHIQENTFKLILGWGAFGSPTDYFLRYIHKHHQDRHPKALCIGGNAVPPEPREELAEVYDLLFYETQWYEDQISWHPLTRQAFGINKNIYHELPPRVDDNGDRIFKYDVLMVGHFLPWKRHYMLLQKPGRKIAVGEIYQEYQVSGEIAEKLQEEGVEVTNMVPPRELADLYRSSKLVYFPMAVVGGGERAVLEARACGCHVEVASDNPKLASLASLEDIPDQETYASQLLGGIREMLDRRGSAETTTRPPMPSDETVVEQRQKQLIASTCRQGGYCPYKVDHKGEQGHP